MISLARSVTILDEHTRLARLEAAAPLLLAAIGTAVDVVAITVHGWLRPPRSRRSEANQSKTISAIGQQLVSVTPGCVRTSPLPLSRRQPKL